MRFRRALTNVADVPVALVLDGLAVRVTGEIDGRMHQAMDVTLTGDVDVDLVRSMVPHHQGAIDMARAALAQPEEAEVCKLAHAVIRAWEAEIAEMRAFSRRDGVDG